MPVLWAFGNDHPARPQMILFGQHAQPMYKRTAMFVRSGARSGRLFRDICTARASLGTPAAHLGALPN
jgi:hypothetical protein